MINLARNPFVNRRPVFRAASVLWAVTAILGLLTVLLYGRYQRDSAASRNELAAIRQAVDAEVALARSLEVTLSGFGLADQNEQIVFLNSKLAERVFPWSRLFDDLAAAMPAKVKLKRLNPRIGNLDRPGKKRSKNLAQVVELQVEGEAESSDALLEFLDTLFRSPSFGDPRLENESSEKGTVSFGLTVPYLPAIRAVVGESEAPIVSTKRDVAESDS